LAFVAVVGIAGWTQYNSLTSTAARFQDVGFAVPSAPRLVAQPGETVFRIDPSRSSVSYTVDERIVGQRAGRATGSTSAIAGDLALNRSRPARSRVGQIVVDVEQLHSNNSLRDARIRQDFLESHDHPLATFSATALSGMPAELASSGSTKFTMTGDMTVRDKTLPVTWRAEVTPGPELRATASTTVKLSDFGVGPINLAGLVSTGDAVTLTLHLVGVDPSHAQVPTVIAAPVASPHRGGGPSYRAQVAPVLAAACASCHNSGQVGAQHWVLDTAADAAKTADGIAVVTASKYMPPWPASTAGVALAHSKALDPKAVDVLARWARAGGALDVPPSTPVRPMSSEASSPAPRRDLTLTMPDPYTGSTSVPNDYRCFVLDPHLSAPTFVTGYEVTPDQRQEIHHAQIFHINAAQAADGLARSGQDGRPGWQCYAGPGLAGGVRGQGGHSFSAQPGLIAGWVPGQDPVIYPQSSGVLFQPGDAIVFQIHYHYDKAALPDRSTVALQTDPGTAPIRPLDIINPLAPVEIPCMPGAVAPLCDRTAALADDARLYGPAGAFIEPGLLLLCHKTATALTAGFGGVATSSCDYRVPESGQIVGAMGHMHTLGKSFRLTLAPDTAGSKVLLDIPIWNFDWQMNYQLAEPLHVTAGQHIRMECSWDRSLDPNRAPKYIVFAEGTEDEMCFSTYAIIPDRP